ncbi:MAG: cupin domain-containing protein [Thermoanaerobaculia bacterium]
MKVINVQDKLSLVHEPWKPHVVAQVNDSLVKVVKLRGEFVWHHHAAEDEMFLVVSGTLRMRIREWSEEREETIRPGEFIVIPHGVDHLPIADEEVHVILFEPQSTVNTGSAGGPRTVTELPHV